MIWKTINGLGKEVVWYSKEHINKILENIKNDLLELIILTNEYDSCYYKDKCDECEAECQYKKVIEIIERVDKYDADYS